MPATHLPAELPPVERTPIRARTSDRVYDQLAAAIRDLRLPPGASLSETELAAQLHVSRTPLREAIARLAENGLVTVVPQVGTRVALISLGDVVQAQFVREHLEVAAFTVACGLSPDISALRESLARQELAHASHDVDAFFAADETFHERIFAISGYPGAWRAMQSVKVQLDRLRRLSLPEADTVAELIAEHTMIVDALEARDIPSGVEALRGHARRVLDYGPTLRGIHPEVFTS
ncbi:GntR family transcriptional regulator [Actinokineospora sp. HUAS TT18]|uniref:GntR family transcriptional regulator n=1 Tax=Actinokineospora sp. HUAS TT18 TaxID=3447451 RepID=UPI003F52093F